MPLAFPVARLVTGATLRAAHPGQPKHTENAVRSRPRAWLCRGLGAWKLLLGESGDLTGQLHLSLLVSLVEGAKET